MCVARNKDNSWPEEIIAVMKEVRAKDKENKENKDTDKHQEASESNVTHSLLLHAKFGSTCLSG